MDLNYLFHRQQISLMRADAASCAPSRRAHAALAALFTAQIDLMRQRSGAAFPASD